MKSFNQFLSESSIHYFDIDDTLAHPSHKVKIHVLDKKGERVESLSTTQFNTYKLPKGHRYDFSDFRSADLFEFEPIRPMLAKMKAIEKKGNKVEILTARSDFDNQPKFAEKWKSFGVDINKIHVRRAGNHSGLGPAAGKAKVIADAITKYGYDKIYLYDDSKANIDAMLDLKKQFPKVTFIGYLVQIKDSKVKLTSYKR